MNTLSVVFVSVNPHLLTYNSVTKSALVEYIMEYGDKYCHSLPVARNA